MAPSSNIATPDRSRAAIRLDGRIDGLISASRGARINGPVRAAMEHVQRLPAGLRNWGNPTQSPGGLESLRRAHRVDSGSACLRGLCEASASALLTPVAQTFDTTERAALQPAEAVSAQSLFPAAEAAIALSSQRSRVAARFERAILCKINRRYHRAWAWKNFHAVALALKRRA